MAQHKAATAVTIAPTEEKSGFANFVDAYWKIGLGIALAISAGILWNVWQGQQATASSDKSWEKLLDNLDVNTLTMTVDADPAVLNGVIDELKGTDAGPWSLFILIQTHFGNQEYEEALAAIQRFRSEYPDHTLAKATFTIPGQPGQETVLDRLQKVAEAEKSWRASNPGVYQNPPLPQDAPRVRLNTEKGAIVVGLYTDQAPKHCENFLKLCGEGFYDGTLFHRITKDQIVQGGDPNTKEEDKTQWGFGGPGYNVEREESKVWHFRGYLAAAKKGQETESSGSQFYFTVGDIHHLDNQHVVYGKVLEGMELIDEMSEAELDGDHRDRPAEPVKLLSTEIL